MEKPDLFSQKSFLEQVCALLEASAQQELCRYAVYLLSRQRHTEVMQTVFQDETMSSALNELIHSCTLAEASADIRALEQRYYALLQKVQEHYAPCSIEPDGFELARDLGNMAFENIGRALLSGNPRQIAFELREFQQMFQQLSAKANAC